jgi:hypothetical protein
MQNSNSCFYLSQKLLILLELNQASVGNGKLSWLEVSRFLGNSKGLQASLVLVETSS